MISVETLEAKIQEIRTQRDEYIKQAQAQVERFNGAEAVLAQLLEEEAKNGMGMGIGGGNALVGV